MLFKLGKIRIMLTSDSLNKVVPKTVNDYTELIKIVARIEHSRLSASSHIIDYSELLNIAATAVYVVLSSQPSAKHSDSYIYLDR